MKFAFCIGWAVCLATISSLALSAQEKVDFLVDIKPILAENCFACHGLDEEARQADLRLDVREAAVDGGAILPGDPEGSSLVDRIYETDDSVLMPPPESHKKLSDKQKDLLKRWVAEGADYQKHWSLVAPERPELPQVSQPHWVKNEIDQFVLDALEKNGLSPAAEANPATLFRRLCLDTTGLPPKPSDMAAFLEAYPANPDAVLSQWIDQLMSRSSWGEHRGRYWLDAARYADTHGMHFDNYREMYPYRDWVIRAFNQNQPFDQFTIEQLAGDLLENPNQDQLIATGFQRCNMTTNEGGTIDEENLAIYAADRVQTFGWVFLGLTTNCAQCHDHKFDPITTRDYYSLAAFFRNTTQPAKDGNVKDGRGPSMVVPVEADMPRWNALPDEIATAIKARDERKQAARADFEQWLTDSNPDSLGNDIPTQGLIAHALLNEGTGQSITALIPTGATYAATGPINWVPDGQLGSAAVLKTGATFDLGSIGDFEKDQAFSYGAWVRAKGNSGGAGIIGRMDEQANFRGFDLWQQGLSLAVHLVDTWPGNAIKVSTPKAVLKPGQWQHVLATYDGSGKPGGIKIYVDGKSVNLRTDTNSLKADASIRTTTPLRIGQRSQGAVFQDSSVQDFRIYDRALTPDEVMVLAEAAAAQALLTIPADQRTDEQKNSLYEFYLNTDDPEYPELVQTVANLEKEKRAIQSRSPITHIQTEKSGSAPMANILMRGAYDKPGDQVIAKPPSSLHPMPESAEGNRLGLAYWVVDPANPLTTRVTVNRFWQELFGQGIVATAEDFGVMGTLPSNQDLLDWLAIEFRESGWDVKQLFKLMLMSATYRQAAVVTPEKLEKDRDNRLLSRGPRFRMDAEMVRDYALAASDLLNQKMYGPGTKPYQPDNLWNIVGLPGGDTRNFVQDQGDNVYRRSLYTFWKRMSPPPNLEAFNAPNREVCTVRRERTNTPLQALVTLNDPQFFEAARVLAQNAMRLGQGDWQNTLNEIASRTLCRNLQSEEVEILKASFGEFFDYYQAHPEEAQQMLAVGQTARDEKLDANLLAAWTMLCNQMLNLDESLNK